MDVSAVFLVPPCFLPGGVATTAWPADDGSGLHVFISELIPKALRNACVTAAVAADPDALRVLHLTT